MISTENIYLNSKRKEYLPHVRMMTEIDYLKLNTSPYTKQIIDGNRYEFQQHSVSRDSYQATMVLEK